MAEAESGALDQEQAAEVPPGQTVETEEVNGDPAAPEAAQEGEVVPAAEQTASSSATTPQKDLGFKKVFKLGGFKFTLKKDREEPPEPVTLLTVKDTDAEGNGNITGKVERAESQQQVAENGADTTTTAKDPEKCVGDETAVSANGTDAKDPKGEVHENGTKEGEEATVGEPAVGGFAAHVTTPLRKMFNNRLFAGLRKKPSKAEKDDKSSQPAEEPQAESKPEQINAEPAVEVTSPPLPQAEEKPSCDGEVPLENTTDTAKEYVLAAIDVVTEALKKHAADTDCNAAVGQEPMLEAVKNEQSEQSASILEQKGEACNQEVKPNDMPEQPGNCEQVECSTTVADFPTDQEQAPDAGVVPHSPLPENPNVTKDTIDVSTEANVSTDDVVIQTLNTEHDSPAPDESKAQSSPLKKFFMGGPLKKLSMKKGKEKSEGKVQTEVDESGNAAAPHVDDQTASPSAIEVDSQDPLQSPAQPHEEAEGVVEKKRDGITPWSSFKKLVKPKRRTKKNSEDDDKEEEPGETGKTTTMSSTTSGVSGGKDESVNSDTDEHCKEDGGKKRNEYLSANWESLICIGSSKKRGRKSSDSDTSLHELQKQKEAPVQDSKPESVVDPDQQFEDVNLEVVPKTTASKGEEPPEKDEVQPDEPKAEVTGAPKNTSWSSSLKRLVTPKKRNKSKDQDDKEDAENLENENGELQKTSTVEDNSNPSNSTSLHQESSHQGTHSAWSLKRLIPGKKKKPKLVADEVEDAAEVEAKSNDSDTDTPAVVPLAEYDNEVKPQVQPTTKDEAADGGGNASSNVQAEAVSDNGADGASVQETLTKGKANFSAADCGVGEGKVDCSVLPTDVLKIVEVGDEKSNLSAANEMAHTAQEESLCAEESVTIASEAVTKNLDSPLQQTNTSDTLDSCNSEVSPTSNTTSVACDPVVESSADSHAVISKTLEVTETSNTLTSVVSETVVITSNPIQTTVDVVKTLNEEQKNMEELPENVVQHCMQLLPQAIEPKVIIIEKSQTSCVENLERPPEDGHVDEKLAVASDVFIAHQLEQIPEDINEVSQDEKKEELTEAAEQVAGAGEDMAALIQKAVRVVVRGTEGDAQCGEVELMQPDTETPHCDYVTAATSVVEAALKAAAAFVNEHSNACEAEGDASVEVDLHEAESHPMAKANDDIVVPYIGSTQVDDSRGVSEKAAVPEVNSAGPLESVDFDVKVQEIADGQEDEADQKEEQEVASESITDGKGQVVHGVENGFVIPTEKSQEELEKPQEKISQDYENVTIMAPSEDDCGSEFLDKMVAAVVEPTACEQEILQNNVDAEMNKDSLEEIEAFKQEVSVCESVETGNVELKTEASGLGESGVAVCVNPPEELLGEALSDQALVVETIQEANLAKEPTPFDSQEINPTGSASQSPAKETSEAPASGPADAL